MTEPAFPNLSRDQVASILDQNTWTPPNDNKPGLQLQPGEIYIRPFNLEREASNFYWLNSQETKERIEQWCRIALVFLNPEHNKNNTLHTHVERLDNMLSPLIVCNFWVHQHKWSRDEIIDMACALLARLPAYPPELPFEYQASKKTKSPWPEEYFVSSSSATNDGYDWSKLRVLSRPTTNVVLLALYLVMQETLPVGSLAEYLETITTLLDTITELFQKRQQQSPKSLADARALFVLQAFTWATWYQTTLLQLWRDAKIQMKSRASGLERQRQPMVVPKREVVEKLRVNYMCKWAFELLRSDLSSVTQDFRRLFEVYNVHFGDREPRCNLTAAADSSGKVRVCDGKAPGNCQRFESDGVQIQSAHDVQCPGLDACTLITWDEESYKSTKGARAVSLEDTDDKYIRYCPVTTETLAVSHVWSHGQGGRPETGFNLCLHRRYTKLARSLGCNSYWMDSPCIPTEMELRYEAMGHINHNFINSKVTLLVDRDLMEIDIDPPSLEAKEAIVATLVVCDWNVRAWTLLEGMRGCWNLHILGKNNHIISLIDVLNDILAYSNLSLVSPCLALQHYIPQGAPRPIKGEVPPVGLEQATCLMNHRHATKDRDVTMIWSLVCGSKLVKASVDFWKSQVGQSLTTGFLLSSSPRLEGEHGFSWAPSRPNLLPPTADTHWFFNNITSKGEKKKVWPAYDGEGSSRGFITEKGFKAEWLVCRICRYRPLLPARLGGLTFLDQEKLDGIQVHYFVYNEGGLDRMDRKSIYKLGSLVSPVFKKGFQYVALLFPVMTGKDSEGGLRPYQYQGEGVKGPLMVIAGSNDLEEWEWQFVHEWDTSVLLPQFIRRRDILLV